MNLDSIPAGERILVDANIIIYARREMSDQCRRLLTRCADGEIEGVITTVSVAEFCHRRMMQEAQSLGLAGSNPAKNLSQNPALIQRLIIYKRQVEDLLAGDLTVLAIESNDILSALELQKTYGLLTNDSLQLAAGIRSAVRLIATADPQFKTIPDFTIFSPDDVSS